jgi:lipoprotein-anchoring transpeptidase ErfK/SrfK
MGQSIPIPTDMFDQKKASPSVLGKSTPVSEKKIFVNLSTQKLYALEGNRLIYEFTISSGKWNPTPVGKFYIWTKLLATHMEGGEKENNTYYNLPNVPYTMYFYNENVGKWNGYGIHGAYWPVTFGQPESFGCITLQIKDAAKLYYWADAEPVSPPTPVIIFGKAHLT